MKKDTTKAKAMVKKKRAPYTQHIWSDADDALFLTKSNQQIANIIGVSYTTVQQRRVALGMPLVKGTRRKHRPMRKVKVVYVPVEVKVPQAKQESKYGLMSILRRLFRIAPAKAKRKSGARKITLDQFKGTYDWDLPVYKLKHQLGVSFGVAKRLKQETLALRLRAATVAFDEKNKNRNTQR